MKVLVEGLAPGLGMLTDARDAERRPWRCAGLGLFADSDQLALARGAGMRHEQCQIGEPNAADQDRLWKSAFVDGFALQWTTGDGSGVAPAHKCGLCPVALRTHLG